MNLRPADYRINGPDTALEIEQFQQLGNGRDLNGFLLGGLVPRYQAVSATASANKVERLFTAVPIARSLHRLDVDRDNLASGGFGHRTRLVHEAVLEGVRLPPRDQGVNAIAGGNPVGKRGELAEPIELLPAEHQHRLLALGAAATQR